MNYYVHPTSIVDDGAAIGDGTKIWHFSHIYSGAKIGQSCSFGQNTMVADGVIVGNNVKVQNNVAIYAGTVIEDDVFLGPSCVLTNISNPRSQVVRRTVYENTTIRRGATVGANATIVCGVTLGRYCFISAGAVVTRDVPDYALVMGVPAQQAGWMSRHGHKLVYDSNGLATCPESGLRYRLHMPEKGDGNLLCEAPAGPSRQKVPVAFFRPHVTCLDVAEDQPLPEGLSIGSEAYRVFKRAS